MRKRVSERENAGFFMVGKSMFFKKKKGGGQLVASHDYPLIPGAGKIHRGILAFPGHKSGFHTR